MAVALVFRRSASFVVVVVTVPVVATPAGNGTRASDDMACSHRHRALCKGATGEDRVGQRDVGARENGALEGRGRQGHGLAHPPGGATRVAADDREVGGRESSRAAGPNLEQPRTAAGEREGSSQRRRGGEAVGACPE